MDVICEHHWYCLGAIRGVSLTLPEQLLDHDSKMSLAMPVCHSGMSMAIPVCHSEHRWERLGVILEHPCLVVILGNLAPCLGAIRKHPCSYLHSSEIALPMSGRNSGASLALLGVIYEGHKQCLGGIQKFLWPCLSSIKEHVWSCLGVFRECPRQCLGAIRERNLKYLGIICERP